MPELDYGAEIEWGELMLASQDMLLTIKLIERIPEHQAEFDLMLDCIGVVATYAKSFKKNNRGRRVADVCLAVYNELERALHDKIIDLRDKDLAHSDFYDGRVQVKSEGVDVWVRDGADRSPLQDDVRLMVRHSQRVTMRALVRDELIMLKPMAAKMRERIKQQGRDLGGRIMNARVEAGFHEWFQLGNPSESAPAG